MRLATGLLVAGFSGLALLAGCSTARKETPELNTMVGKKVALVDVDAEATDRSIIEVALVNQLRERGTFILVPKQDVDTARKQPDLNPIDWKELARRAGADYALRAKTLDFTAEVREGYGEDEVEDSQLKAERGDGKTQRLYKIKKLEGNVRIQLEFTELATNDTRVGIAEASDQVTAEARTSSAQLPPRLRFLEKLANTAFRTFFERYED
ncbi:MAG: hypothetical protein NDJ89_11470 [Oligoflexia bacterium]|nr:hypothetical protein [Oligoflexia bacterium]